MRTELYIEGTKVDLMDDASMPITFAVADIKTPEKRRNSFTKTIDVPGTKHNNKLFGHLYNINRSQLNGSTNVGVTFNRKKKANYMLIHEGVNLMSGIVQLTSVEKQDEKITYKIVLYSELSNIISNIADKELTDIIGSGLEHQYTLENIAASWSGSEAYVYPVIDYGFANTKMESAPMQTLKPAVFAKYYWDSIFDEAGFTYSGSFMGTDIWDRLILPYNREDFLQLTEYDPVEVTNIAFNVSDETPYLPYNSILEDKDTLFDETTREYTAPENANYDFSYNAPVLVRFEPDTYPTPEAIEAQNEEVTVKVSLIVNDTEIMSDNHTIDAGAYVKTSAGDGTFDILILPWEFDGIFDRVSLNAGDKVKIQFEQLYFTSPSTPFIILSTGLNHSGMIQLQWRSTLGISIYEPETIEGSDLKPQQVIAQEVKQRDFVLGILKLFNLFMIPDPEIPRHMNIVTRDEFYADPTTVDWTEKLDNNRTVNNETLKDGLVRILQFKYKHDDDDWFLNLYKRRWDKEYGEYRIETGYEFSTEIKDVLELPFGTIIPVQYARRPQEGEFRIEVDEDFPDVMQVQGLRGGAGSEQLHFGSVANYREEPSDLPRFDRAYIGRTVRINNEEYEIVDMLSPWRMQLDREVTNATANENYRLFNTQFVYSGNNNEKIVPIITESDDNGRTFKPFDSELRICLFNGVAPAIEWTMQQTPRYVEGQAKYIFKQTITKQLKVTEYPFVSHVLGDSPAEPTYDLLFAQPDQIFWAIGVTFIVDEFGNNIVDEHGNFLIA